MFSFFLNTCFFGVRTQTPDKKKHIFITSVDKSVSEIDFIIHKLW